MYRHRLDAVSLFFGLVFTAVGATIVVSDRAPQLVSGRWLWPAIFIAAGLVLLAGLIPWRETPASPSHEGGEDGGEDEEGWTLHP